MPITGCVQCIRRISGLDVGRGTVRCSNVRGYRAASHCSKVVGAITAPGPGRQHLTGHLHANGTAPGRDEAERLTPRRQRAARHVDQVLRLGAGHLDGPGRIIKRGLREQAADIRRGGRGIQALARAPLPDR
jgi:hypothetical protein